MAVSLFNGRNPFVAHLQGNLALPPQVQYAHLSASPIVDGPNSIVLMDYCSSRDLMSGIGISLGIRDSKLSVKFYVSFGNTRFSNLCFGFLIDGPDLRTIKNFSGTTKYIGNAIANFSNPSVLLTLSIAIIIIQYLTLLAPTIKASRHDMNSYQKLQAEYEKQCAVEKKACENIVQNLYKQHPELKTANEQSLVVARYYRP